MLYNDFVTAIDWTIRKWSRNEPTYETLRKRGDSYWLHLENLTQKQIENEIIIDFLNTRVWCCHLDSPLPRPPRHNGEKGQDMVQNLKIAVDSLPDLYRRLYNFKLYDIDFGDAENFALWNIALIFGEYRNIKPRFGPVPASKLMHMALPDLLMMWDDDIYGEYKVPSDLSGKPSYLAFQILMQQNMRHIVLSNGTKSGDPVNQISSNFKFTNLSFPRLLDIANYAVSRSGLISVCRDCINNANKEIERINGIPTFSQLKIHIFRI